MNHNTSQFKHEFTSVARRQIQDNLLPPSEAKDEPINPTKYEELPITISVPSQSQSSPIIHFAKAASSTNHHDRNNTYI